MSIAATTRTSRKPRAARLAQDQALYVRQQREIEHIESFINRFKAQASKARQAQSRIKALERMQRIAPAHVDSEFTFSFLEPYRLPRPLLTIEDQAVGYGEVAAGRETDVSPFRRAHASRCWATTARASPPS